MTVLNRPEWRTSLQKITRKKKKKIQPKKKMRNKLDYDLHLFLFSILHSLLSFTQSCATLCDSMDCSTPGVPVHHQLLELAQTQVHRVGDAIQPSHPLSSPSPPVQSFPASGSFLVSQLFASGGQTTGASVSASVLPLNIQD